MDLLRIAIQKSGRLSDDSLKLLKEAGISLSSGQGKLLSAASDFPLEVLFLRDDDIPRYVYDGVADIGIVGENGLMESSLSLNVVEKLGFSRCRMALAIARNEDYSGLQWFNGKKIATSYPVILKNFLEKNAINAEIHTISGSVEIAPGIGLADGIFDIVSTGSSLLSNGLKEVEVVLKSEAIMVAAPGLSSTKKNILDKLIFRIKTVLRAQNNKYILLNAPNENLEKIIALLPGMKSPTVMPLAMKGWSSLHSVLSENEFWDIIDKIKALGAEGILVIPIEKMIK